MTQLGYRFRSIEYAILFHEITNFDVTPLDGHRWMDTQNCNAKPERKEPWEKPVFNGLPLTNFVPGSLHPRDRHLLTH